MGKYNIDYDLLDHQKVNPKPNSLGYLLSKLDKSNPDYDMPYEVSSLFERLAYFDMTHKNNRRLARYPVLNWFESASREAGTHAYYLDDVLVFVTTQECYKCDMNFYWVSHESYFMVREYFISLIYSNLSIESNEITLIDPEMIVMEDPHAW